MKKHYTSIAEFFKVSPKCFWKLGVLNTLVDRDIQLFIDPRLLKKSKHEIFNKNAVNTYETYYKNLARQIRAYLKINDENIKNKAKQKIIQNLTAKEPVGLGLGYSKKNTNGQGVGTTNAELLFKNAIDIYKCVPDIGEEAFSLLNILSEGIGADYIGDITANIIREELASFTEDIAKKLNMQTEVFCINDKKFMLPKHPNSTKRIGYPLLIVPREILSDLPKDVDMEDVLEGYVDKNQKIRTEIDEKILNILKQEHLDKQDKQSKIFDLFKDDPELILQLTNYMSSLEGNQYNFEKDSKCIALRDKLLDYLKDDDFKIETKNNLEIIEYIIKRFEKFLANNNKLKRELLWKNETQYKPETAWQQVFHAYIYEHLGQNNINIEQERETGSGPIDFCFSQGSKLRVLIEFKLSKNNPIKGLTKQLEKYKECTDNVKAAYFICINVHKEKQTQRIVAELNEAKKKLNLDTNIIVIDGHINPSASNL